MILNIQQQNALKLAVERYRHHEPWTYIAGAAGTGKAQPNNTKIPTPNGYKTLGQLKVGDKVFDRQGQQTQVTGVFPQGKKEVYKVLFSDGRESLCAGDHLWSYYSRSHLNSAPMVDTTENILKKGLRNSNNFKFKIANNKAVLFPEKEYEIDPYVIGVFLGDGCCLEKNLTLSSSDEELVNNIKNILHLKEAIKYSTNNYNWYFKYYTPIKVEYDIEYHNTHHVRFRELVHTSDIFSRFKDNLIQDSYNKSIPEIYKFGSVEQRLSLLQGLFDTDGSINSNDRNRFNVRYTSVNQKLVKEIQEILWSLGYSSSITLDNRNNKYKDGICYNLNVNIPNEEKYKLFRLSRKKNIALKAKEYHKNKNYNFLSIVDIQKLDYSTEMTCIMVDNEEHLYLTEQFIPTHNTTLVQHIISALNLYPEDVCYIAYTGKAALNLQMKNCPNACTAHSLLYNARQNKETGLYYFTPKPIGDFKYKLIVVDEISMIPQDMWELLIQHKTPILVLGDIAQLPAIGKTNEILDKPHIVLTEIMRQEADSEIIQIATLAREHKPIPLMKGKQVQVIKESEYENCMLDWSDMTICATNLMRGQLNRISRERLWGAPDLPPRKGDKIVCLHNEWNYTTEVGDTLVNGLVGYIHSTPIEKGVPPLYKKYINKQLVIDFIPDYRHEDKAVFKGLTVDEKLFRTGEPTVNQKNFKMIPRILKPKQFDYAYAMSCWKCQGSEYGKVLLFEENYPRGETHWQYLYTGITRSINKLVLIKKDY